MNRILLGTGVAIILIGSLVSANIIPLAIYNTFQVEQPNVICSLPSAYILPNGNPGITSTTCTVNVSIDNNNGTEQAQLWLKVNTKAGTAVNALAVNLNVPSGMTSTFGVNLGSVYTCGDYLMTMLVTSISGTILSYSQQVDFAPCYSLEVQLATQSGSVTAAGPINCVTGGQLLECAEPVGSTITLTGVSGAQGTFNCWQYTIGGSGCPTSNPLALTLNQNIQLAAVFKQISGVSVNAGVSPLNSGTINPTGSLTLYQTTANGPTSITFTETPASGNVFSDWIVCTSSGSCAQNVTASSITLTYSAYKNSGGVTVDAQFMPNSAEITIQDDVVYPGHVTLSAHNSIAIAAPGMTVVPPGSKVTISATGLPTSCSTVGCFYLNGFIVNGQIQQQGATSIVVTVNGATAVAPNVVINTTGGQQGGGTGGQSANANANPIGYVIIGIGGIVTGAGLFTGKKEPEA